MTPFKLILQKIFIPVWLTAGVLLVSFYGNAQNNKKPDWQLVIKLVDKDSSFGLQPLKLQSTFTNQEACSKYINNLPVLLQSKGYPTASIDSVFEGADFTKLYLFLGRQYQWINLVPAGIEKEALSESRFANKDYAGKLLNIQQLLDLQDRLLNYYENNGYPFAEVYLDSIRLDDQQMQALLKTRKGPLYHVDSIRTYGKLKISKKFLNRYLGIANGSLYSQQKINLVGKRLLELPYLQEVQPSDLTLLGTGSVLNLYLAPKKQPGQFFNRIFTKYRSIRKIANYCRC